MIIDVFFIVFQKNCTTFAIQNRINDINELTTKIIYLNFGYDKGALLGKSALLFYPASLCFGRQAQPHALRIFAYRRGACKPRRAR